MKLSVDGKPVEVAAGATILDAARKLNIAVPTLCHADGLEPTGGCSLCVVRVEGRQNLLPSCAARAEEGMCVTTNSPEIRAARLTALELLLSDHTGDCEAPCTLACPAGLDIPEMMNCVKMGDIKRAHELLLEKIPLARITGRICPAYCERVCRRGEFDEPIAIRSLERFVADSQALPGEVSRKAPTGKRVAVIGAGAAGLSAASCLAREGHTCELFDAASEPGGLLRKGIPAAASLSAALDAEIADLTALGCRFIMNQRLGGNLDFSRLRNSYDATLIACGASVGSGEGRTVDNASFQSLGLHVSARGIAVDSISFMTNISGIFAAGEVVSGPSVAVRAIAAGRDAAAAINCFLRGESRSKMHQINVKMGKLSESAQSILFRNLDKRARIAAPEPDSGIGFPDAQREAARCIQCQCLGKEKCALRRYAEEYSASVSEFRGERRAFERDESHPRVTYESGKCILCGLCVRTAAAFKAPLGINFTGRGFTAKVGVPFGATVANGLGELAGKCARVCPTGALALRR